MNDIQRIPSASGVGFRVRSGQLLRVVAPEGRQVADLFSVSAHDLLERFSPGRTIDYNDKLYVSTGDRLWSGRSRPMWSIVSDDVGRHDLTLTPCSRAMFALLRDERHHGPGCWENLCKALSPFGVSPDDVVGAFNIFMDVRYAAETGAMTIGPPPSRPGDAIELRAEMDLFVGLTACASETTNDGTCKPMAYSVRTPTE